MTTLNFLENAKSLGKAATVALVEAGKDGERCGASRYENPSLGDPRNVYALTRTSRWTPAFFRLDKGAS
jgi:tricarballylate dehydrogenase